MAKMSQVVSDGMGGTGTLGDLITQGVYTLEPYTTYNNRGVKRQAYRAIRADKVFYDISEAAYRSRTGLAVEDAFTRKRNERAAFNRAWREIVSPRG